MTCTLPERGSLSAGVQVAVAGEVLPEIQVLTPTVQIQGLRVLGQPRNQPYTPDGMDSAITNDDVTIPEIVEGDSVWTHFH